MSNTNTGGTAFAQCSYNMKGGYDITGGMTLRDYFAAKAMQALISSPTVRPMIQDHEVAGFAYRIADAMLKARQA